MTQQLVLVTGGSGFLGAWCIIALVKAGYRVRTTVRSLKREADVRTMVERGGAEPGECVGVVSTACEVCAAKLFVAVEVPSTVQLACTF